MGISIGYDGDRSFDVYDPSIFGDPNDQVNHPSLVNYHNFQPGPGGSEAPNGLDVEIPLADQGKFMDTLSVLKPGMSVHVCGHWVADMHQLWNELHPVTVLNLLPEFSVSASPADITAQVGDTASFTVSATLNSGPSTAVALSVSVVSVATGLPVGFAAALGSPSISPSLNAPATSILTISNLAVGDYKVIVQGTSQGFTRTTTVNLHVYS
jgi:hypothetical protein